MGMEINEKIEIIKEKAVRNETMLCVKYFIMTNGGTTSKSEITIGLFDCVDDYRRLLCLVNGINIPIDDIYDISGGIFYK